MVVAGSGHSALTALVAFAGLAEQHPSTRITWMLRRDAVRAAFGGGEADPLPARGALGLRARRLRSRLGTSIGHRFRTGAGARDEFGLLTLVSSEGQRVEVVDEVVALAGFRPDPSWLSEVRLALDATLQAPVALAPLSDPNVHSCGTVYPHGVKELAHRSRMCS